MFPDLSRFFALLVVSEPVDERRCDRVPIPSAQENRHRISFQQGPPGESKALSLTCNLDVAFFRIGSSSPALATRLIGPVGTGAIITARPPRSLLGRVSLWRWHASGRVVGILRKVARRVRSCTFRRGGRRPRRVIGCGHPGRRAGGGGGGGGRQEIFLAHGLVRSFHLGPHQLSKPLCNDLEILVPVHAAHIGLGTLFRGSLLNGRTMTLLP